MLRPYRPNQIFGTGKGWGSKILLTLIAVLFNGGIAMTQEVLDMPKPIQFEENAPCGRLVLVKKMPLDIDDHHFLAFPRSITIDNDNAIYIYDSRLKSIFKFDKKYKFVTRFLSQGRGPAEVSGMDIGIDKIYYSPDSYIYVRDIHNDKLVQFTKSGKHVKDIKLNRVMDSLEIFPPVVDKKGFIYAYSLSGGIVDKMDSHMNIVHSYLNQELNRYFIIFKSAIEDSSKNTPFPDMWLRPTNENTAYDVTNDNRLVIYSKRLSRFFIFDGKRLVRQFDVLLKEAMEDFREKAIILVNKSKKEPKKGKYRDVKFLYMFGAFFLDKDDGRFFYLQGLNERDRLILYKFNTEGQLVKILTGSQKGIYFLTKRNHLFYGLLSPQASPVIFREEAQK